MEDPRLETHPEAGLQAPNPHLPSRATWRQPHHAQTPASPHDLTLSETARHAPGDPGQPRQEDRRRRRGEEPHAACAAPPCQYARAPNEGQPDASGLDTEEGNARTTAPGHPGPA